MRRLLSSLTALATLFAASVAAAQTLPGFPRGSFDTTAATSGAPVSPTNATILWWSDPSTGPSNSATQFNGMGNPGFVGAAWLATLTQRESPMPLAGTIDTIAGVASGTLGAGTSETITIQGAGGGSAPSCTFDNAHGTVGNCNGNSATVSAGNLMSLQAAPTSTPTVQPYVIGAVWHGANMPVFSGPTPANGFAGTTPCTATGATQCFMSWGGSSINNNTAQSNDTLAAAAIPGDISGNATAGTFSNLFCHVRDLPGASQTWTLTAFHNGVATSLAASITNASVSGSDTTHSFTVASPSGGVPDTISLQVVASSTAVATFIKCSMQWTPQTPGEYPIMAVGGAVSNAAIRWLGFGGGNGGSGAAPEGTATEGIAPVNYSVRSMVYQISTAPGGATARAAALRYWDGAAIQTSTNAACTIVAAQTECESAAVQHGAAGGVANDWQLTPTGTPAAVTWTRIGAMVTVP